MRVIDGHVHLSGKASVADIEAFIERGSLEGLLLISRLTTGEGSAVRRYVEELAELKARLPDRIYAFAHIDPTYEEAPKVLEWAVRECGIVGLKMLPANFHPADERARDLYGLCGELGIPILMHVGILWLPGSNANNCRPGNMEVLWDFPKIRFAMAHVGWPWTDECIAVAQKFKQMRPELDQAFVDLTPGTPPSYRPDVLAKCLENVGAGQMIYGSDRMIPTRPSPENLWRGDREIFDRLGVTEEDQQKIFADNLLRFLGCGL